MAQWDKRTLSAPVYFHYNNSVEPCSSPLNLSSDFLNLKGRNSVIETGTRDQGQTSEGLKLRIKQSQPSMTSAKSARFLDQIEIQILSGHGLTSALSLTHTNRARIDARLQGSGGSLGLSSSSSAGLGSVCVHPALAQVMISLSN
ncbi:hypothetical protein PoB_006272800 [Plakobranchus ocellatus]|uniref:Uncharacterized protein n=1 Tax=Plakobranchus ocellatus TaxID=259542 RepID=A0AAV4CWH5_9GAST|nr:hypothetical protein PoB_006272800 [Plakobranchus ocellatus]